jgi:hypothetical protein
MPRGGGALRALDSALRLRTIIPMLQHVQALQHLVSWLLTEVFRY